MGNGVSVGKVELRKVGSRVKGMRVPNLISGPFSPPVPPLLKVRPVVKGTTNMETDQLRGALTCTLESPSPPRETKGEPLGLALRS
jgi:hypothetical protein